MTILIRYANAEDIPQIVILWKRFMIEEEEVVSDGNPEEAEASWTVRLRNQIVDLKVIVADNGGDRRKTKE